MMMSEANRRGTRMSTSWLFAAAVAVAMLCQRASAATNGTLFLTFGDSLSDTGNLHKLLLGTIPRAPWYWDGRFTNSPGNWQDHVNDLDLATLSTNNRAYGGAKACSSVNSISDLIPSFSTQIKLWEAADGRAANQAMLKNKTVIAVIWTGHNDLLDVLDLSTSEQVGLPGDVAACILAGVERLLELDYIDAVVVGTLAPLEQTPFGLNYTIVNGNMTFNAFLTRMISRINTYLAEGLYDLGLKLKAAKSNQTVVLWDAHAELVKLIGNWSTNGFKFNNTQSCIVYKPGDFVSRGSTPISYCGDQHADEYLFIDKVHPTSRSHIFIGNSLLNSMVKGGLLQTDVVLARRRLQHQWHSLLRRSTRLASRRLAQSTRA